MNFVILGARETNNNGILNIKKNSPLSNQLTTKNIYKYVIKKNL